MASVYTAEIGVYTAIFVGTLFGIGVYTACVNTTLVVAVNAVFTQQNYESTSTTLYICDVSTM